MQTDFLKTSQISGDRDKNNGIQENQQVKKLTKAFFLKFISKKMVKNFL